MALKRKLSERDAPEPEPPQSPKRRAASESETSSATTTAKEESTSSKDTAKNSNKNAGPSDSIPTSFADFELDARLLRGCRDLRYNSPTAIQAKAIPLALQGLDIIGRSGTGTGKTAAYLLPIAHNTLKRKGRSLILVPTKELATQITKVAKALSVHCGQEIRVQNISGRDSDIVVKAKLADADIIIATPARASANINNGALAMNELAHLVVDEADLILSYGYSEDMSTIAQSIPPGVQKFLMSATLNTEVESLGGLLCNNPVTLKLDDLDKDSKRVKQYVIKCAEEEKFLLVYAMFKLGLIKGKTIIFVGDVDRSYRVKLFLEQFGVKSCVLNSELPLASRLHIVEEFNKNVYNILIASDETEILGKKEDSESRPKKKSKTKKEGDKDSGVSRGIDFINVAAILQFDLATNYKSYFHRIGRTARAGKSGTAISFVIPKFKYRKHKSTTFPACEHDEEVLAKIEKHQEAGQKLENYNFDMKRLEPFRYRFGDALRSVTRIAIREARIKEIRMELSKSQKLSRYFEENPEALAHLRHDQTLNHPARIQPHLKHVPDYLLPGGAKKPADVGFVGLNVPRVNKKTYTKGRGRKVVRRNGKVDPLKTFNARGKGKK